MLFSVGLGPSSKNDRIIATASEVGFKVYFALIISHEAQSCATGLWAESTQLTTLENSRSHFFTVILTPFEPSLPTRVNTSFVSLRSQAVVPNNSKYPASVSNLTVRGHKSVLLARFIPKVMWDTSKVYCKTSLNRRKPGRKAFNSMFTYNIVFSPKIYCTRSQLNYSRNFRGQPTLDFYTKIRLIFHFSNLTLNIFLSE